MSSDQAPDAFNEIAGHALSHEELLFMRLDILTDSPQFNLYDAKLGEVIELYTPTSSVAFRLERLVLTEQVEDYNRPQPGRPLLARVVTTDGDLEELETGDLMFVDTAIFDGFSTLEQQGKIVKDCDLAVRKIVSTQLVASLSERPEKEIQTLRNEGLILPMMDGQGELLLIPSSENIIIPAIKSGIHGPDHEPIFA